MARALVGPQAGCALHGAILTAAAIPGVIPLVHSTPGCALRAGLHAGADLFGKPPALPLVATTNLAEKHVIFGGTSRLREEIKNTLAVVEGGLIVVLSGCPTEMIGDDVAAMVKEVTSQGEAVIDIAAAGFRGPVRHGYELVLTALAARLEWPTSEPAEPDPDTRPLVNLFGILPDRDPHWLSEIEEIARLLAGVGLRANPIVGPAGGLVSLQAIGRARASLVLSPWGLGPAEALRARHAIPVVEAGGLPVGAEAAAELLRRLAEALGHPLDARAEAFLAAEQRHEDFQLDGVLAQLAALGRRRFALVGGSLEVPGLARFLVGTLGWKAAAVIVTDEPSGPARAALAEAGVQVLADGAAVAAGLAESGADLVLGGPAERGIAAELGLAHVELASPAGLAALTGGFSGRPGAARLLSALIAGLEAREAPATAIAARGRPAVKDAPPPADRPARASA